MILIPIQTQQGMVTIQVTIQGTTTWEYRYFEDQHYRNDSALNHPKSHILGLPHDLQVLKHAWDFTIINPSDSKIKITIGIDWFQQQNGQNVKISQWGGQNFEIPAGEARDFSGTGYLVKN